jgi:anion-transporting  ArsA/GET3 family ATPase
LSDSIEEMLDGVSVCICVGSGGVGKTTSSAAIAAGMAARGRKVAVLTIDPAKRLADSLGLHELGNDELRVDPALYVRAGVDANGGELWATMLDAKATFDEVVRRHSPDRESRERILGNRIYQQISGALAGSQEYMAMERLYELSEDGKYDLLVLDTPPSRNALDFLDAPRRLIQFVDGRAIRIFIKPTGLGMRVAGKGFAIVHSLLKRLTGTDLIQELTEFFTAMSGMVGGFRQRAARVEELLAADDTAFLIVCGPAGEPLQEAVYLREKLDEADLPFGGLIVNRVHRVDSKHADGPTPEAVREALGDADLAERVIASYEAATALSERDARNIEQLRERIGPAPMLQVPERTEEVHDLAGLLALGPYLFGSSPPSQL